MNEIKRYIAAALFVLFVPFSAVAASGDEFEADDYLNFSQEARLAEEDPLEGFNRAMHSFNEVVDNIVLGPVAKIYKAVLPQYAQNRVYNFLDNVEAPVVFINSLLQGDPQNLFVTFWRFVFNTTLGVGGIFDIATELGVPQRSDEDFGQTLGVWGVGQGAYLELPIIGPSSLRDAPGRVIDIFLNPFTYALEPAESVAIGVTRAVDTRARLDRYIDQVNTTSLDPYATFRSLYLQRRAALVSNFADPQEKLAK